MRKTADLKIERHTLNDVKLAEIYFPILVDLAVQKRQLTYKELIEKARRLNPDKKVLASAIPVSTGRKLACIHSYCVRHNLPVLPSLVVNKGSGSVGEGFYDLEGVDDANTELERVYEFDWSTVVAGFGKFLVDAEKKATPKKRLTEKSAIKVMYNYYKANKESLPDGLEAERKSIIANIMDGESAEDAFFEAIGNL